MDGKGRASGKRAVGRIAGGEKAVWAGRARAGRGDGGRRTEGRGEQPLGDGPADDRHHPRVPTPRRAAQARDHPRGVAERDPACVTGESAAGSALHDENALMKRGGQRG